MLSALPMLPTVLLYLLYDTAMVLLGKKKDKLKIALASYSKFWHNLPCVTCWELKCKFASKNKVSTKQKTNASFSKIT